MAAITRKPTSAQQVGVEYGQKTANADMSTAGVVIAAALTGFTAVIDCLLVSNAAVAVVNVTLSDATDDICELIHLPIDSTWAMPDGMSVSAHASGRAISLIASTVNPVTFFALFHYEPVNL